jgi:hypothetical protein
MGQGFAAGKFDKGCIRTVPGLAEALACLGEQGFEPAHLAVIEGVLGIAVDTAQGAPRQADEQAGPPDASTFPLDRMEHLIDFE